METLKLKPCPFCGDQPRLFHGPFEGEFLYKCDNVHTCETTVSPYIKETKEDAAMVWNNRANIKYWPCGVHKSEDGWEYLGSVSSMFFMKTTGLDIYRHEDPNIYAGISMQYGPSTEDVHSYEYISSPDMAKGFENIIILAYAVRFNRLTKS